MASASHQQLNNSLRQLHLENERPWLVGFSGGKDSTGQITNAELRMANESLGRSSFHIRHSAFDISTARQKGIIMSDWKETNRLRELQEQVAAEQGVAEEEALKKGMEAKSKEFQEKGAEILHECVASL